MGLGLGPSATSVSASSAATIGFSPVSEALGCLSVDIPVSSVHASSSPLEVSSPTAILEQRYSRKLWVALMSSVHYFDAPTFSAVELLSLSPVDVSFSIWRSSGVGSAPFVRWNSFHSPEELSLTSLAASLRS
jgi:hypothetical protein